MSPKSAVSEMIPLCIVRRYDRYCKIILAGTREPCVVRCMLARAREMSFFICTYYVPVKQLRIYKKEKKFKMKREGGNLNRFKVVK